MSLDSFPGSRQIVKTPEIGDIEAITQRREHISDEDIAKEAVERMQVIFDDPDSFIDSGGAATVHRLSGGACMKVLNKRIKGPAYDQVNSLDEEARITKFLSSFSKAGVRSPRYIAHVSADAPLEMRAIVMEELPAVNLQRVFRGEAIMPETFDLDAFMDALETYIDSLNSQIGIAHGDLEPRNIMVDIKTGLPRVIDFGRAYWLKNMEDTLRKKKMDEDWNKVERVAEELEKFVAQRKKIN